MPRPRNAIKESARRRTEIWREGRLRHGRPESSIIDRAIAASVAAFFGVDFNTEGRPADIDMIVDGAKRILVDKGFDRSAARDELERRLTRRPDLAKLEQVSGASEASARQFHRAD
jgi:hypothetical protein